MSDSIRPHRQQPTRHPHPWDSPGKNARVDCHFLLQLMKVKSENEVAQSCPTLSNPMDCSLPDSSVHGIFPGKSTGVGCHCLLHYLSYTILSSFLLWCLLMWHLLHLGCVFSENRPSFYLTHFWVDPEALCLALTGWSRALPLQSHPSTSKAFLGNQQCCSVWQAHGSAEFCELTCLSHWVSLTLVHPSHHLPGSLGTL